MAKKDSTTGQVGDYSAKSLAVLEGLDAVRKRPGMYIGTTDSQGLMHCLWEIIDNSVDEALAGACTHIKVILHTDGSITVEDNGRGIPVDIEPKTKLSGVEVVLTKLHAGAKFGESSYNAVGGLHGVGSSVVNALSARLDVEVDRDGKTYRMEFHQGHPGVYTDADPDNPSPDSPFSRTRAGRPTELRVVGSVPKKRTGTRIRYWTDPEIFNSTARFDYSQLIDRVRQTSFLVPGLKIEVVDEAVEESGQADETDRPQLASAGGVSSAPLTPVASLAGEAADADAGLADGQAAADPGTDVDSDLDLETDFEADFDGPADSGADGAADADDSELAEGSKEFTDSDEGLDDSKAGGSPAADDSDFGDLDPAERADGPKFHPRVQTFLHEGGVVDFVDFLSHGAPVSDIWHITGVRDYDEETQVVGAGGDLHASRVKRQCGVDIALRWVNGYEPTIRSYVNVVETPGGGMHVDGFLGSLTKQVRKCVEENARRLKVNLKDSAVKVERDDVTAGLVAVVSVRIAEPQFQGQTKDVLGTAQVKPIVTKLSDEELGDMLSGSRRGFKAQAQQVLEKIVGEMHARIQARKTKEVTRRKNALESSSMPAKLSDCLPGNDDIAELFIVEGDSALGTAKAARNSSFQALLPIRGKILNVEKASVTQMLGNAECAAIIQVIGAGSGRDFDLSAARYNKIVMMTDADVDGAHIRILLLTLFYRYMRPLVEAGHVYAAVPPLHRIELTGSHKGEYVYTYSEDELGRRLAQLKADGIGTKDDVQRYKGLGEMDADQLADTTMDPRSRMLRRIRMEDAEDASRIFELLMGDDVPPRRDFLVENAEAFDRERIDA